MAKKTIKDVHLIKELAQVKALAEPIRLRLLESFCQQAKTTKQAASEIGELQLTKLYHHVEALEKAGLIKLVKTVPNRGTVEKYYQAVAKKYAIDQRLFAVAPETAQALDSLQMLFAAALEETMTEVRDSIANKLIVA